MSITDQKTPKLSKILERRFIEKVMREEAQDINQAMLKEMKTFSGPTKADRGFNINNSKLIYTHAKRHRFIDMKRRKTKTGVIKKKSYPIHNRILFGHMNNIVHRIGFGLTDDVIEELKKLDGTKL